MSQTSEQRARLGALVEELTTTGRKQLKEASLKELKKIVRISDDHVRYVFYLLNTQLEKDHAEIRLSAVQVIDQLFRRSHLFRTILLDKFQAFLEQTVETDPDNALPPPKSAAKELKMMTLRLVKEWHALYHTGYKSLTLALHYLENCKRVEWDAAQRPVENTAASQAESTNRRYRENIQAERARTLCVELDNQRDIFEGNITELENCVQLLLPSVDDPFQVLSSSGQADLSEPGTSRQESTSRSDRLRLRGLPAGFNLTVKVDHTVRIVEGPENTDIIANLKELSQVMRDKHLPLVHKWLKTLSKLHGASTSHIKYLIDLKEKMERLEGKLEELKIETPVRTTGQGGDSSDEDDDFEEVEQKDIEALIPPRRREEYGLEPLPQKPLLQPKRNVIDETTDPTSRAAQYKKIVERYSQQAKRKRLEGNGLLSKAPSRHDGRTKSSSHRRDKSSDVPTEKRSSSPEAASRSVSKRAKDTSASNCEDEERGPGCSKVSQQDIAVDEPGAQPQNRKGQLLKMAPKVNFDIDLIHWEDEKLETAVQVIPFESHNGFHKPRDDDQISAAQRMAGEARLRERKIDFSGTFQPVQWMCRAPLPSGKLCPRQDRYKCPFHGKIIARDKMGRPSNEDDAADEPSTSSGGMASGVGHLDWQDPELLRDIEAETGIDLRMPPKRGAGKKRKKDGGLTDVRKEADTVRRRLEKKVFNKSSVMRVAATLDAMDSRKYDDKFGDQWNYS